MFRLLRIRPPHGWSAVGWELGIVTLGVLLALAAQQIVEALGQRTNRAEARAAIEGEISRNLDGFRRRAEIQHCVDSRLREIETLLTSTPLGSGLPRPLWIGRPQIWGVTEARLDAATSGARTALLSGEEQAGYSEVYNNVRILEQAQDIEQLAWARLRSLESLPSLDSQSRADLLQALHEARFANFRIVVAGVQSRELAKAMGVEPGRSPYGAGSRSVCIAIETPRATALKLTLKGRRFLAEP